MGGPRLMIFWLRQLLHKIVWRSHQGHEPVPNREQTLESLSWFGVVLFVHEILHLLSERRVWCRTLQCLLRPYCGGGFQRHPNYQRQCGLWCQLAAVAQLAAPAAGHFAVYPPLNSVEPFEAV